MTENRNAAPGWYPHPESPGALRYWNGSEWTDHHAPVPEKSTSAMTIARGVALGLAAVIAAGVVLTNCQANDNRQECLLENVDRAIEGLPARDCD